jgi:hypothetical protein
VYFLALLVTHLIATYPAIRISIDIALKEKREKKKAQ